jgi:hypothetical protein
MMNASHPQKSWGTALRVLKASQKVGEPLPGVGLHTLLKRCVHPAGPPLLAVMFSPAVSENMPTAYLFSAAGCIPSPPMLGCNAFFPLALL